MEERARQGREDAQRPRWLAILRDTDARGVAELRARGIAGINNRNFRKRSPLHQTLILAARRLLWPPR